MKAVFIHDHNFVYNETNNLYYDGSGGAFNPDLWNRYLQIFDSLIVIGRKIDKLPNKLTLSSTPGVVFSLIDDLKSIKDRFLKKKLINESLLKILNEVDFAIIRLPSVLGYWAISHCKTLGIKYTLEIVGDPFEAYWNYGNLQGKMIAPIEALKLKSATKNSMACIYVTKQYLQKKYPSYQCSTAISNVRLEETMPVNLALNFYREPFEVFKIGLIGSFHVKYKGHIEALKAIKNLKEQHNIRNIKLFLVGTGNPTWITQLAEDLEISDLVEVVGALKSGKDGIIPFLDNIHLYIHPSMTEGLPRVVLEAMSRGRICLASSVGGTPELLDEKFLHKPGDWNKLCDQIVKIYMNRNEWEELIKINLNKSAEYLEVQLQNKRSLFITSLLN